MAWSLAFRSRDGHPGACHCPARVSGLLRASVGHRRDRSQANKPLQPLCLADIGDRHISDAWTHPPWYLRIGRRYRGGYVRSRRAVRCVPCETWIPLLRSEAKHREHFNSRDLRGACLGAEAHAHHRPNRHCGSDTASLRGSLPSQRLGPERPSLDTTVTVGMRILIISGLFDLELVGGQSLRNTVEGFVRNGHTVDLISMFPEGFDNIMPSTAAPTGVT